MADKLDPDRLESLSTFVENSETIAVLREALDMQTAAERLGISVARLSGRLTEIERRAARRGWTEQVKVGGVVGEGFHVKGLSAYGRFDEAGEFTPTGGWVKTDVDKDHKLRLLLDAITSACEPVRGLADPVLQPKILDRDLFAVYPIGDLHLGMYAWAAETGESCDLTICTDLILGAAARCIKRAPPASLAILANMGDWFHSDTPDNRTSRAGHALDVDTRWGKIYARGIEIQREITRMALEKHDQIIWENLLGNHDDVTSQALAHSMSLLYEREPRVTVSTSPAQHRYHELDQCLMGFHHGHETPPNKLPGVMTVDQREAWGRTRWRKWYCGHIHHIREHEFPGCTVEYVRTTTPRDMWATGAGYRSDRDLRCDVWHRKRGYRGQVVEVALTPPDTVM